MRDIGAFLDRLKGWIATQPAIIAVLLVGSYARGTARDDSDIDLVLITESPTVYLQSREWLSTFGRVVQAGVEDWGLVQSVRVFYEDGTEVEFGFTTAAWAATTPVDAGTREVVADGAQIVQDRNGMLAALLQAVRRE